MAGTASRILSRVAPGVAALSGYQRSWFRSDLVAGVSVAAVAIPIAMAYAQVAGLPPVYGLYASILPLVAYALFGTSRQLVMAPDAAACAIVAAVVVPLAAEDVGRTVSLSMTLAVMTGVVCIAAGLFRLGFLANFLARPILVGYFNGIAIHIIMGQLGKLFGFPMKSQGFFKHAWEFVSRLGETHALTLAIGLGFFVGLRLLKRFLPKVPAPLAAVVLGILAAELFHLKERGVALLGEIPAGLPSLVVPQLAAEDWGPLASGAVGLALISFSSAMVTARGFAVKNRYEVDANGEFIALGAADIGAGVLQGFAVSGAASRTAVADSVGGKSQVTGLVAAGIVVLCLLFLTGPLAALPMTVLAAVLISAVLGLFDVTGLRRLWRISPQEFGLSAITLLGVITVGVLPAVLVAVGLAIVHLLMRASSPHDAVLGRVPGTDQYHNVADYAEAQATPGVLVYRFDSGLVFFNSDRFKSRIRTVVSQAASPVDLFVLSAESMPSIDITGAAALGEIRDELCDRGILFAVAAAKGPVRLMMEKTGITERVGPDRIFPTVHAAVVSLQSARA